MLDYNLYELKEIKSLRDLQKNQEDVKKDLFNNLEFPKGLRYKNN